MSFMKARTSSFTGPMLLRCGSHCWKEYLGHPDPPHGYPSLGQLFLILPVQAGGFNPLGILLGLFCALILLGVLFLATIILSHLITKTLFFKNTRPWSPTSWSELVLF